MPTHPSHTSKGASGGQQGPERERGPRPRRACVPVPQSSCGETSGRWTAIGGRSFPLPSSSGN